jgi:flavin reductase (DIM6/NTAB) family NADH-FMN oxidoreductase RutF
MLIDPATTAPRDIYKLLIACITPRPIAWVSTVSPRGVPNLAPFSFFNGIGANPPSVLFCPVNRRDGSKKDTLLNVEATKEFVVNIVPFSLAKPMNDTSADLAYEVNEFETAGIDAVPSLKVKPPRVKDSPVYMECVLHQIIHVGEGALGANVVIGRIVCLEVSDAVLNASGEVDARKLDTIGRMGGSLYSRTTDLFELPRPIVK